MMEFPLVCDSCDHVYECVEDVVVSEIMIEEDVVVKGYACTECKEPMFPIWKRICALPLVRRYMMLEKLLAMEDITIPSNHPALTRETDEPESEAEHVFPYASRVNDYTYIINQPSENSLETGETCLVGVSGGLRRGVVVDSGSQEAVVELLGKNSPR